MAYSAIAAGADGVLLWARHRLIQSPGGEALFVDIGRLTTELSGFVGKFEDVAPRDYELDTGGAKTAVRVVTIEGQTRLIVANPNRYPVMLRARLGGVWRRMALNPLQAGVI